MDLHILKETAGTFSESELPEDGSPLLSAPQPGRRVLLSLLLRPVSQIQLESEG